LLRLRFAQAEEFFSEFQALLNWAERMKAIGHGAPAPMTRVEALAVAKGSELETPEKSNPRDPQGLKPGMRVTVQPVTDGGDPPVAGIIRAVDRNTIALTREDPTCGVVVAHFPRVGYHVAVPLRS
jgi:hypothetical protein